MLDREKMLRLLKINRDANRLSQAWKALNDVIVAIEAGNFDTDEEEMQKKCERYEEALKWYGELPCIQENQVGWNVGYVARQALRKEMKEAI